MSSVIKTVTSALGLGGDDSAAKAAADAQERANQSRIAAEQAAQNMQKNFAADLKLENTGQVVAGGTADTQSALTDIKKKKLAGTGLSSTLGINV